MVVTEHPSLAAEAYAVVRQRMLRGELLPGQPISRRRLAVELGMSFLPVSEALLKLELEGLLESRPRAGTRVCLPSRADVEGHFVLREALEVQAAMLFAATATPREHVELRRLAGRVDALSMQPDRATYLELHLKLHRRIAECTRCDALSSALERIHALGAIWFCAMREPAGAGLPTRHQELVEALCSGDPRAAADAVRGHIESAKAHALEILEPYFQQRRKGGRFVRQRPAPLSA